MNENAKKWVEALRSGQYRQTRCSLSNNDAYCCLGVACKLYEDNEDKSLPRNHSGEYRRNTLCLEFDEVAFWLGIQSATGEFYNDGNSESLVDLNDSGKSFKEIANIIESEPEGLFNVRAC